MKNLTKFLSIGALALGVSLPALAQNDNSIDNSQVLKQRIEQQINQTIHTQLAKGFLTEKAQINLSLLDQKNAASHEDINEGLHLSGTESAAARIDHKCIVDVVFDAKGNLNELIPENKLQNEKQKEIMHKFVALHESFHCEFSTIDQPIIAFNKDSNFQKKINYLLKEQVSIPDSGKIAYTDILNENFADVGAAMSLLKEYGTSNSDLNYVLKNIIEKRGENYSSQSLDTHYSQFSLQKVLSKDNLSKIDNMNAAQFHEIILNISNLGTQNAIAGNTDLMKSYGNLEHTMLSIQKKVMHTIYLKTFTPEEITQQRIIVNNFSDNVERGLTYDATKMILEDVNVDGIMNDMKVFAQKNNIKELLGINSRKAMTDYTVEKAFNFKTISPVLENSMADFVPILKDFSSTFEKPQLVEESKNISINKNTLQNRIGSIRSNALNSNNNNQSLKM